MAEAYELLADVYEWLIPEHLLTPDGSAAAFAGVAGTLDAGARVLDCACGTGQLAVGLARRGFEVVAGDASPAMVERTLTLAERHGERLAFWPFRHQDLDDDLRAAGFEPASTTYAEDAGRYLVTARPARRRRTRP